MTHTIANKPKVIPNTFDKLFSKALVGKPMKEGATEAGVKFGIHSNFCERDIKGKFYIKSYPRLI